MPTYQYRCTECGTEIERVQKFSDAALTTCEDCGGRLRKVYNPVGIVFKGSGFYATDNRTKGSAAAAATPSSSGESTSSAAASTGGSSSGGSSETSSTSSSASSTTSSGSSSSSSTGASN